MEFWHLGFVLYLPMFSSNTSYILMLLYFFDYIFDPLEFTLVQGRVSDPAELTHGSVLVPWRRYFLCLQFSSVQLLSRVQLCDPTDCSTPGFPVRHQLLEFSQIHVHWVSDTIQPAHPLSSPSSPAINLSQHQGLFQWLSSSHQVASVLEFQLQHQSFQWTPRTGLL